MAGLAGRTAWASLPSDVAQNRYLRIEGTVSEWSELHLSPPVAANLEQLGWTPDHPRVREVSATTARGHHAAVVAPPSPAWASPAMAGVLSRLVTAGTGRLLVVCPQEAVGEWAASIGVLAAGTPLRLVAAHGPARATRLLHEGAADIVVTGPDTILELLARSALQTDSLTAVALLWPEQWATDAVLTPLMQDLSKDAQRLIVGSEAAAVAALVERYARKAPVVGPSPLTDQTVGPVRTASASWQRRSAAVAELAELLDPAQLTIWTADTRLHAQLGSALAGVAPGATFTRAVPESPAGTIVALDLPDALTLQGLIAAGEVILLVPPGADAWVASVAAPRRPIPLPGTLAGASEEVRARRRAIADTIETSDRVEAGLVLGPLLERYEAPAVAAALYTLWTRREAAPQVTAPAAEGPAAKVWIGAGRRDEVGPNELVAFLTREIGLDKAMIGRIEVRESFALVEVPQAEAERIAALVSGKTIRRRRLAAKVDRGPAPARAGRPRERTS
jgi:hypothetical protein